MSESTLKILIVGHDLPSKCAIGNIIRGTKEFKPLQCRKVAVKSLRSETIQGYKLHICVTPNLSTPMWGDVRSKYKNDRNVVLIYTHNYYGGAIDVKAEEVKSYFGSGTPLCRIIFGNVDSVYEKVKEDVKPDDNTIFISDNQPKDSERRKILSAISRLLRRDQTNTAAADETKDEVDDKSVHDGKEPGLTGPGIFPGQETDDDDVNLIGSVVSDANRPATPCLDCRDLRSEDWELYSKTLRKGTAPSSHFRVNIVGHQCVGKTTLLHRLQGKTPPESLECTKGLDVMKITSKCIERDDKRLWENEIYGYEKELNIQRMASAMKKGSELQRQDCQEPADIETVTVDEEPQATIATTDASAREHTGNAVKTLNDTADLQFSSDVIDEEIETITQPQHDTNNGAKIITNAEKAEYLQQVVRCIEHSRGERLYISFWDFAGQSGYYSTHQAFLSPSSVYILVVSLQKSIHEEIEDNIEFNLDVTRRSKMTVLDTMKFWMDSIRTYTTDTNGAHAPVILVGTHKDTVTEKEAKATLHDICEKLEIPVFIAIDNTKEHEDDPYLEDLKSLIVDRGLGVIEPDIPAQWIDLERAILTEQDKGVAILYFDDLKKLDMSTDVPINDDQTLREFLNYEHLHGCLMYFESEGLENIIILDPMVLVLFLNLLLEKRPKDKATLYERVSASGYCRDGIFDKRYIEELAQEMDQNAVINEHLDVLLKIIVHLRIAFPLDKSLKTGIKEYFMPSLLNEITPEEINELDEDKAAPTIVVAFGRSYAPPAIFHRLIASCLYNNFKPDTDRHGSIRIFNGHASFVLTEDECEILQLVWKTSQIHITPFERGKARPLEETKFSTALEEIVRILDEIIDLYRHKLNYELFVVCPQHDDPPCLIPVSKLIASGQFPCKPAGRPHAVDRATLLTFWYPNEVTDATAQRNFGRPDDKMLGRLALKLPLEPSILVGLLKLECPSDVVKEVKHDYQHSVQWQLLVILFKWKRLNPEATVGRLRKRLTKQSWCTEQIFDESINPVPPTSPTSAASHCGVPAGILQRQPSQREIAILCKTVGINYVFLFLELGLEYVIIEQERENNMNGGMADQITALLHKWRQKGCNSATYRQLFECAKRVDINTEKMWDKIKGLFSE